jgi:hypothetical protein
MATGVAGGSMTLFFLKKKAISQKMNFTFRDKQKLVKVHQVPPGGLSPAQVPPEGLAGHSSAIA